MKDKLSEINRTMTFQYKSNLTSIDNNLIFPISICKSINTKKARKRKDKKNQSTLPVSQCLLKKVNYIQKYNKTTKI
jgi:hypothetical protein